ncbi:hypothetical protein FGB62_3g432 [Gracilaria domingensis]|nr:hypothetical protein FGB62_3g432 [Gracilaria domingensis]
MAQAAQPAFANAVSLRPAISPAHPTSLRCPRAPVPVHQSSRHAPTPQPLRRTPHMRKGPRSRQPVQQSRPDSAPSLPEDGTPVFAIFVRSRRAKLWYPLGAVKGDDRSKSLVDALKGGFAKGMYENALDKGIAQTVYGKDSNRFQQNALRMYPQLKKSQNNLEFGYKVAAKDLDERPIKLVAPDMALPFPAWVKKRVESALQSFTSPGGKS